MEPANIFFFKGNKIMKNKSIILMTAILALFLAACGDDGSSSSANSGGTDFAFDVETLDDLPNCTAEHERDTAFVKDGKKIYVCEEGRWEYLRAVIDSVGTVDELSACTNAREGDSVLVVSRNAVYVCDDGRWEKSYGRILTAESSADFPACTDSRDGDKAYAASERTYYVCDDGKWEFSSRLRDSVSAEKELPNCMEKTEGDSAYIKADNTVRLCRSERWLVLGESVTNRDSLKNCTSGREGARAFLENEGATLVCSDGKWTPFDVDDLEPESSSSVSPTSSSDGGEKSSSSSSSTETVSCSEYKCVSTEYLNQELLASGKYGYLVDTRDSQVYRTIEIGEQTWMAQNLNYAYNQKTSSLDSSSFCYNNEPDSCAKYGRLYLWSAAMDSAAVFSEDGKSCGYGGTCENSDRVRGVCPAGWHLPDSSEFEILLSAVGGAGEAGKVLKASSGWNNRGNGTDSYGFSALPAGGYYPSFVWNGFYANFYTSSRVRLLLSTSARVTVGNGTAINRDGYSVRCLKD